MAQLNQLTGIIKRGYFSSKATFFIYILAKFQINWIGNKKDTNFFRRPSLTIGNNLFWRRRIRKRDDVREWVEFGEKELVCLILWSNLHKFHINFLYEKNHMSKLRWRKMKYPKLLCLTMKNDLFSWKKYSAYS